MRWHDLKEVDTIKTKRLTELALLATIALTIFIVELQIPNPFPIPGVKLGLANIITVYMVYHYRPGETVLVLLTRILLGALFSGNIMSLFYSLTGGMLCLGGMLVLRRFIPEKSLWFASVVGAVLHNIGQIAAAMVVLGTTTVFVYFPFLLVSGCLAGTFTGFCAQSAVVGLRRAGIIQKNDPTNSNQKGDVSNADIPASMDS